MNFRENGERRDGEVYRNDIYRKSTHALNSFKKLEKRSFDVRVHHSKIFR